MRIARAARSLLSVLLRPRLCHTAIWRPIGFPLKSHRWTRSAAITSSHGNLQPGDFTRLPLDKKVEEETVPDYKTERFYPVRLGDVFNSRYKVSVKLGFGTASTVWLCRDLETSEFWALKVCIAGHGSAELNNELLVSRHIVTVEGEHPGRQLVRVSQDDFQIRSAQGMHQCLVFRPLGMTFTELRNVLPAKALNKELLQRTLHLIAVALDFLHQAEVVYTDLSPNNILLGISDPSVLSDIEKAEIENPSPRKELPDRRMPITHGVLAISDFGAAKIGNSHTGDVMPAVYRAPEIIMKMQWDCKIDTWALGVMIWDLFEGGRLFRAAKENTINDELHIAEMVSLMGPPPKKFLRRSPECSRYWDSEGNWIAETAIPDQSLETRERRLEGTDKELLLKLVRKILRWLPEERASAYDVFEDDFVLQYLRQDAADRNHPPNHCLQYIYALGGGELIALNDYHDLLKAGITPEQEIVTKHIYYFGPVPESLDQQIKDENWRAALRLASRMAEAEVEERRVLRLKVWGQELGETAIGMPSGMTNLDPKARLTID